MGWRCGKCTSLPGVVYTPQLLLSSSLLYLDFVRHLVWRARRSTSSHFRDDMAVTMFSLHGHALIIGFSRLMSQAVTLYRPALVLLTACGVRGMAVQCCGDSCSDVQGPFDAAFFNAVFGNVFDQREALLRASLLLIPGG